jgi:hypothetical protein
MKQCGVESTQGSLPKSIMGGGRTMQYTLGAGPQGFPMLGGFFLQVQ